MEISGRQVMIKLSSGSHSNHSEIMRHVQVYRTAYTAI